MCNHSGLVYYYVKKGMIEVGALYEQWFEAVAPMGPSRLARGKANQASCSIFAATSAPVSGSRAMTAMVSSPAMVPTM